MEPRFTSYSAAVVRCGRMLVLLAVCLLVGCFSGERELPVSGSVSAYQGSWEFRYGACPQGPNGQFLCTQADWNDGSFVSGQVESPNLRNGRNELWLRTRLTGPKLSDPYLLIKSVDQTYEAFLNGELVDKSDGDLESRERFAGVYRAYIPLGTDYVGKTLTLRIYARYWHIGIHREQLIGDRAALLAMGIRQGLPAIMIGSMLLVLALTGLSLAVLQRNRSFALYGSFALMSGIYVLARSSLRIFVFGTQELARTLELSSLALLAAALCGFVASMFGRGPLGLLRYFCFGFFGFFVGGALLVATGIVPMESLLLPLQFMLLAMVAVLLINVVRISTQGGIDGRILSAGLAMAMMPTLYDLLSAMNVLQRYVVLTPYSVALFVLAVFVVVMRRFVGLREQNLTLTLEANQVRLRLAEQDALLQAAKRLAEGDLDTAIDVAPDSSLKSLALALNRLREDVRSRLSQLSGKNSAAKQLNDELRRQIEQRSRRLLELIQRRPLPKPSETPLKVQSLLGDHYRIVCLLGTGASGVVVEVERITDNKHLAAKVLTKATDQVGVTRFLREAQILARLDHPNLVAITDVDVTDEGVPFLVMELVEGQTLRQLRSRYRDPRFALSVLRQVADALTVIHQGGIIHRDLRPSNILVTDDGAAPRIKLFDFGVAALKAKEGAESGTYPKQKLNPSASVSGSSDRLEVSLPGMPIGSPMYMAPECRGGTSAIAAPADVFSLGVIAWELLTGDLPFARPPMEMAAHGEPLTLPSLQSQTSNLNPALCVLVTSCLHIDPQKRLTAAQVAAELALQVEEQSEP
ncbi:MAG: protein kinase [Myxococcales bacterium]|nr:protein kinase [Myxococcales bacterium]